MVRFLYLHFLCTIAYKLHIHPLENKIAYVKGIRDIKNLDENTLNSLREDFKKYPLLMVEAISNGVPQ